tara:strand:- start:2184 stop:2309 length:126 start_codon:yes stop_codon:yes gene_type:complete
MQAYLYQPGANFEMIFTNSFNALVCYHAGFAISSLFATGIV